MTTTPSAVARTPTFIGRNRGRLLISLASGLALLLGGIVALYVNRAPLNGLYYGLSGRASASTAELQSITDCTNPGFKGLLRILWQDLSVGECPGLYVADALQTELTPRRANYLRRFVADRRHPGGRRFDAAMALVLHGGEPTAALGVLAREPGVRQADLDALVARVANGELPDTWLDPHLRAEVAWTRLQHGDDTDWALALDDLRLSVHRGRSGDEGLTLLHMGLVRSTVGIDQPVLDRWNERIDARLPVDCPIEVCRYLREDGDPCEVPTSQACLDWSLGLRAAVLGTESDGDGDPAPPWPADTLADPIWEALWPDDPEAIDAARRRVAAAAALLGSADAQDRPTLLLDMVANPQNRFPPPLAKGGPIGDPLEALERRRASPWTTALAAELLGTAVGMNVRVERNGNGVVVEVGTRRVGIGPCGESVIAPPQTEAWPLDAVLAQAAIEGAGAALRDHDPARARRLARLAEKRDPIGAAGVSAAVDAILTPTEPDTALGIALGGLVRGPDVAPPGAEVDRKLAAKAIPEAPALWATTNDACSRPLGP